MNEYKGKMPKEGEDNSAALRDWCNKYNQLLDEMAKIAEKLNGLWVGIMNDLKFLGIQRCDSQDLVGKHDVLSHISDEKSYAGNKYEQMTKALFRMKYIVPANMDTQWYVDANRYSSLNSM